MSTPETTHDDGVYKAFIYLPLLGAAIVVCVYLTYGVNRSLWLDEANSVHIASGTPGQIIESLSRDVSPPLYYLLLSGWMRLTGSSEIALRSLSILFYLAGICVIWIPGRMLFGTRGGALASFLYAINPIVGRQAQNVRMYTLLAFIVTLSFTVFIVLLRDEKRRTPLWFALFGLTSFLGLNTHYWFVFVLFAYGCWLLVNWRSWQLKHLLLLAAFTILPFAAVNLALFLHQAQLPSAAWTPRPTLKALRLAVLVNFGLFPNSGAALFIGIALAIAAPVVWAIAVWRRSPIALPVRNVLLPCTLYLVALLVPFLISLRRPIFWPGRYDIIAIPFFTVLLASLLLLMPPKPRQLLQFILAAACCVSFVRAVDSSERTRLLTTLDPVPLDDRAAAQQICSEAKPGDYVIYTGLSRAAVGFYLQRLGCGREVNQVSYPAEFERHLGWEDPKRAYSREPALQQQGQAVTEAAYASGHRVFLLLLEDKRMSAGIVSPLDRHFRILSDRGFVSCGACFDELRIYAPSPERSGNFHAQSSALGTSNSAEKSTR